MTGELTRTSPWRLLVTLDGPEFDNFGGGKNSRRHLVGVFFTEEPGWMFMDGRMQE
jgi:hypothetical protein